jgi:hypothetical protein
MFAFGWVANHGARQGRVGAHPPQTLAVLDEGAEDITITG